MLLITHLDAINRLSSGGAGTWPSAEVIKIRLASVVSHKMELLRGFLGSVLIQVQVWLCHMQKHQEKYLVSSTTSSA